MMPFEEPPRAVVVRCPVCGTDAVAMQSRLAEMPATADGVRNWKAIGRSYIHSGRRFCDEALASVTDLTTASIARTR
ncbi:MAG: hypothetical protein ACREJ6_03330 [Candidatus Methylomirabilis sp.]